MSHEKFRKLSKESGVFTDLSMEFQEKIMERSGLGDCTYLPQGKILESAPASQRLQQLVTILSSFSVRPHLLEWGELLAQ